MTPLHAYDSVSCDATQFTGKERDSETGLDYFGARYYGSNMGRWMSPDWSDAPEPVPYADLTDPQTLNLYGYLRNNPLPQADADGHCPECIGAILGNLTSEYIFFGGKRVARFDISNSSVHYYITDHLGSSTVIASSAGANEREEMFYPYGGERWTTGTDGNHYKFTGKERDSETGLDYFGARYYGSNMGRFMQSDTSGYSSLANPQAWNLYAYTLNNPLRFTDPSGHTVECKTDAATCQKNIGSSTGSAEAAKRVQTATTTTHHSFLGIKWTTSKTTIQITGDMKSFRALGQNASRLADLVESQKNFTYDNRETYFVNDRQGWLGEGLLNPESQYGGGYSQIYRNDANVYVRLDPQSDDSEARLENIPGGNVGEVTAHELEGHVWGAFFGKHAYGTAENKQDSVDAENAVRRTDPSRGQKKEHDHDQVSF